MLSDTFKQVLLYTEAVWQSTENEQDIWKELFVALIVLLKLSCVIYRESLYASTLMLLGTSPAPTLKAVSVSGLVTVMKIWINHGWLYMMICRYLFRDGM